MAKKGISRKRDAFWKDIPGIRLKSLKGLKEFDPAEYLGDREEIARALAECLLEGDQEAFVDILAAHVRVRNKARLARRARLGRKTLYRVLDGKANPRLGTIMAFMRATR